MEKKGIKNNIVSKEKSMEIISETFKLVAESLANTVGPYGSTTIIQSPYMDHYMSKDGYTVLKNIFFEEDIPRTILDMIKDISRRLVRTVGDGSTSSVLISFYLFEAINKLRITYKMAPQDILNIINGSVDILEKYIKKEAIEVDDNNIGDIVEKVASISTNNDKTSGRFIREVFEKVGKFGFITLENGDTDKDYFEIVDGFEIRNGYTNSSMINDEDGKSSIYEDMSILMINDEIDDNHMGFVAFFLEKICLTKNDPLLIIANGFSDSMIAFFDVNIKRNKLPLIAVEMDAKSSKGKKLFSDLSILTGTDYFDTLEEDLIEGCMDHLDRLGTVGKVIATDRATRLIEGGGNKDLIQERLTKLQESYTELEKSNRDGINDMALYDIRRRMTGFEDSMAIIKVGGYTKQEKETRKFLLEDAVFACKSVIDYGYVMGGNLIVPYILEHNEEEILDEVYKKAQENYIQVERDVIYSIFREINMAFRKSFSQVLKNAYMEEEDITTIINTCLTSNKIYNIKERKYEDIADATVINSAQTDIEIVKACFSLISMLAVSNQFLTINK